MRASFGRVPVGAAVLCLVSGCMGSDPVGAGGNSNGNNGVVQAEYDVALKKWQTNAPVHYRVVVAQTCECTVEMQRPTRLTVRRTGDASLENIEEIVDAQTGGVVSTERRAAAKSVDGLLILIQQALALKPDDARITYDGTLGFPISVNIDPVTSISGDELVYKVTSVETIP